MSSFLVHKASMLQQSVDKLRTENEELRAKLRIADLMLTEAQHMVGTKYQAELATHLEITRKLYTNLGDRDAS